MLFLLGVSCSAACGILVPKPGIKPASPVFESGFLTTVLHGKSLPSILIVRRRLRLGWVRQKKRIQSESLLPPDALLNKVICYFVTKQYNED